MYSLDNARTLVIGLGKTGNSIIKFLKNNFQNIKIRATDLKTYDQLGRESQNLTKELETVTLGKHIEDDFKWADIIFVSPGVDLNNISFVPNFSKEIINDIELAFRTTNRKFIGITGSNGKSTTTKLFYEMLQKKYINTLIGGNYGNPILDEMERSKTNDPIICELSSFQLENIIDFQPETILFLNLSEDHLDRYPNYKEYIKAKSNIFTTCSPDTNIIYNFDDKKVVELVKNLNAKKYSFSWTNKGDITVENNELIFSDIRINLNNTSLKCKHQHENIMAAALAAFTYKVSQEDIQVTIDNFVGIPHRTEYIKTIDGIEFYNDSKATNVGATVKALESFHDNIILIAGGKDKGGSLQALLPLIKSRTKAVLLIGEAQERFYETFKKHTRAIKCSNLEEAVLQSKEIGQKGDIVLLSPACSSYDMFSNYEERGNIFKRSVNTLI